MSTLTPPPSAYFAQTSAEIIIPTAESKIHDIIHRWTDERLSNPALVVIPSNTTDITAAGKYAAENRLTLLVGGGGHKVVPINEKTLYLDMHRFKNIDVDTNNMLVTFGGGVSNQELLEALYSHGVYTTYANSGAVGMVGLTLGGGFTGLSSLHGLAMDNVVAFEGVTASGEYITIDITSTGEERALFDVLCGAGAGLLVIASMTMHIYQLSSLQLKENKEFWVRKWIFPGAAIETAAEFFKSLFPAKENMLPVLIFARSPPSSPFPGQPILILTVTYFGPSAEAEAIVDPLITPEITKLAIDTNTTFVPFVKMFEGTKMFDIRGGFKSQNTARCMGFSTTSIVEAFQRWKQFGDEVEDARPFTVTLIVGYNPSMTIANGSSSDPEGRGRRPFAGRARPFFGQTLTWYQKRESQPFVEKFIADTLAILRKADDEKGYTPNTLPNNFRDGSAIELGYTKEELVEIRRVHRLWNKGGLFYDILDDTASWSL
ncbi:hypothetical protein B7463_g6699, partial [Scytalidium lignicola]